jgi:hypothetical protein
MSTTFGIRIDNHFEPIARRSNNIITIINPLILLLPNYIKLENDNSSQGIETVGDLYIALSKQNVDRKPTDILREDVLTNEME